MPPRKTGLGKGLPNEPERTGKGHTARYGYVPPESAQQAQPEIRYLGRVKGWDTVELYTSDPREVGRYLASHPSYERVWISARGSFHREVRDSPKFRAGRTGTITLVRNTENQRLTDDYVQGIASQRLSAMLNKQGTYDVDFFSIRTKEPL